MFCEQVKEFLSQRHIAFLERNVAADESALAELQKLHFMATPVTVVDDEAPIVGFDPEKLDKLIP
jgi:glutaredoxin